ncbi:beta-lactamase family protein [Mycoplasmatota bacterium]|nr:beta-lactamase family protein [Mycoplasmatota bacterium]
MLERKAREIDKLLVESNFSGSVLVEVGDNVILSEGYGMANVELSVKNTRETKFRIASITKQFTAAAILQLVEKKLLNLDDKLSSYIKDYPNGENITIHHLLTHSSGISNLNLEDDFCEILKEDNPLLGLIDKVKAQPFEFSPGEKFSYSASGYLILSYIIETVSNKTYDEYLQENIFDKLSMKDSGYDFYKHIIKNRASGYELENDELVNSDFVDMRIASGGGALYSTVEDLHKWNVSLLGEKVVNKESLKLMFTNHIQINQYVHYGYGLFLAFGEISGKDRHMNYHSGGGAGFRSINSVYLDDDTKVIILSNLNDKTIFNKVSSGIGNIVLSD